MNDESRRSDDRSDDRSDASPTLELETGRQAIFESYSRTIIDHKYWVIGLSVLFTALCSIGLLRLELNPDSRLFFGENNPQRLVLEETERVFSDASSVVFIVSSNDGELFSQRSLAALERLTDLAWTIPYSFQVASLATHQVNISTEDSIDIEELFRDAMSLSQDRVAEIRATVMDDEYLVDRLISHDGTVSAVNVLVKKPETETRQAVFQITNGSREIVRTIEEEFPGISVGLSGGILIDATFAEAGLSDVQTLVPLVLAVIAGLLWIGFRSLISMAATLVVVGFSGLIAMGLGGFLGYVINAATTGTPMIVLTLCVADCVHFLVSYGQQRSAGQTNDKAISSALEINIIPISITSITTAIGFLVLNFSESPPLRELGTMVAIGMLAGWILSLTFLPALMSAMPAARPRILSVLTLSAARLAQFSIRRRHALFLVFLAIVPVLSSGVMRLNLNDNVVEYFDDRFAFRRDTDRLQDNLSGIHVLLFPVHSGADHGITTPDYLSKLDAFGDWLEAQPDVVHVYSLAKALKEIGQTMNGGDENFYRVPDNQAEAAQYLFFYEMALPFGLDIGSMVDIGQATSQVSVTLDGVNSTRIRDLGIAGRQWLQDNAPNYRADVTGQSFVYAYITERNIRAMISGTFIALCLISLILLFVLKSVRFGLLSLVPNLVPAICAFGVWGFINGQVNLAISIVGAMTLGIVVDDTVHFLSKYLWVRRRYALAPKAAIRETFRIVGPALMMTSATLIAGFLVLAMSGFAVSSQAGMISAITIAIALIADLIFLPSLVLKLEKARA